MSQTSGRAGISKPFKRLPWLPTHHIDIQTAYKALRDRGKSLFVDDHHGIDVLVAAGESQLAFACVDGTIARAHQKASGARPGKGPG